jgi:hypothetical protein
VSRPETPPCPVLLHTRAPACCVLIHASQLLAWTRSRVVYLGTMCAQCGELLGNSRGLQSVADHDQALVEALGLDLDVRQLRRLGRSLGAAQEDDQLVAGSSRGIIPDHVELRQGLERYASVAGIRRNAAETAPNLAGSREQLKGLERGRGSSQDGPICPLRT